MPGCVTYNQCVPLGGKLAVPLCGAPALLPEGLQQSRDEVVRRRFKMPRAWGGPGPQEVLFTQVIKLIGSLGHFTTNQPICLLEEAQLGPAQLGADLLLWRCVITQPGAGSCPLITGSTQGLISRSLYRHYRHTPTELYSIQTYMYRTTCIDLGCIDLHV